MRDTLRAAAPAPDLAPDVPGRGARPPWPGAQPKGSNPMSDFWDDPEVNGGAFAKFDHPGEKHEGVVALLSKQRFDNRVVSVLVIDTPAGERVRVTCGAANLKRQVIEARPQVGDYISITYTHDEAVADRDSPLKMFDVSVRRPDASGTAASTAAPAA
jgi:hypothetical protein